MFLLVKKSVFIYTILWVIKPSGLNELDIKIYLSHRENFVYRSNWTNHVNTISCKLIHQKAERIQKHPWRDRWKVEMRSELAKSGPSPWKFNVTMIRWLIVDYTINLVLMIDFRFLNFRCQVWASYFGESLDSTN